MATTTEMGKGPRGSRTSCPTRGSILAAPARWLCAGAWLIVVAISTVGATTTAAASAASAASDGVYRVRSLVATTADGLRALSSDNRRLYEFIPTFSEDGVITELPYLLSLQLRGIGNATAMSSGAYDAIQNAMSEYLRDVLGERWGDSDEGDGAGPVLTGVTTEIVAERALNNTNTNTSGGAGTRRRRTLQDGGAAGGGVEVDLKATLTFRGAEAAADGTAIVDGTEDPSSSSSSSSVPPQEDLEAAAGDVWNDLSTFETVYLADVLADEDASVQQEFAALESIGSAEVFPTSPPAVAPVTTTAAPVEVAPTTAPATPPPPAPSSSSSPPQPTGNIVAGINDSDTPPAQPQTGLNPLWPALIVGVAVFLCTILVLGYRRQQVRDGLIGNKADSTIHVHDNLTYDGEEEIEVEDHYLTGGAAAAEAAAAAASSGAARSAPRTAGSYDASVEDEEGGWRHASSGRCGRSSGPCRAIRSERYRDGGSVSRISASLHTDSAEEYDLYATMDAAEKHNFLRWMQLGVSIEEASERVLRERQRHSTTSRMSAPAKQKLHSEIMEDGRTMVHVPQHLLADSCSAVAGGGGNAQARKYAMMSSMVMSEASSVASSFDDREYLRVGGSALNSSGDSGQRSLGSRQTRASSDGLGGTTRGGAILGRHESEI